MSGNYSVINDLYGVEPARQEPQRQGALGLVIIMLLGGMFLYESVHPVMRLRSDPPPIFLKNKNSLKAARARGQVHLAGSYWSAASQYVSEKYPYGETLPSRPPEDFTLAMGADYATSNRYWQRLRGLWEQPDMWVTSYRLDTGWINTAYTNLAKVVKGFVNT